MENKWKINLVAFLLVLTQSCSWHNFAPTAGAGIGAGVGSLGGAGGAIAGGLAGGAIGQIIEKSSDPRNANKVKALEALSRGDAEQLIQVALDDQKGWVEKTLDGLINLLVLAGIGFALWNVIPILYSRYLHKKNLKS